MFENLYLQLKIDFFAKGILKPKKMKRTNRKLVSLFFSASF